jgi:hypothetical protein
MIQDKIVLKPVSSDLVSPLPRANLVFSFSIDVCVSIILYQLLKFHLQQLQCNYTIPDLRPAIDPDLKTGRLVGRNNTGFYLVAVLPSRTTAPGSSNVYIPQI